MICPYCNAIVPNIMKFCNNYGKPQMVTESPMSKMYHLITGILISQAIVCQGYE